MKTILIIEDEKDLREALQTKLIAEGYLVKTTESSEEGLKLCMESKPDLIILDIMTHSIHGGPFLQRLRQLPEGQNNSKVIVLTNLDNEPTREKVAQFNIDKYLVKASVSLEEVAAHVKEVIGD